MQLGLSPPFSIFYYIIIMKLKKGTKVKVVKGSLEGELPIPLIGKIIKSYENISFNTSTVRVELLNGDVREYWVKQLEIIPDLEYKIIKKEWNDGRVRNWRKSKN